MRAFTRYYSLTLYRLFSLRTVVATCCKTSTSSGYRGLKQFLSNVLYRHISPKLYQSLWNYYSERRCDSIRSSVSAFQAEMIQYHSHVAWIKSFYHDEIPQYFYWTFSFSAAYLITCCFPKWSLTNSKMLNIPRSGPASDHWHISSMYILSDWWVHYVFILK